MKSLFFLFTKLGFVAFGGPAAHTSMLEEEVVARRKWLSAADFMELIAITNMIPGPNSSELVMAIGYKQFGIIGLIISGISFLIPAMLMVIIITLSLSKIDTSLLQLLSKSLTPVISVIILQATTKLVRKQTFSIKGVLIIIVSVFLKFAKVDEFYIVLFGALTFSFWDYISSKFFSLEPISLLLMTILFLKIGATLYGSGYVLLSYLETTFVENLNWLTQDQIIQAFTIGELTPGPVFTTATAIGTMLGGISGGFFATIAIFLPSFLLMIIVMPISEKLLTKKWTKTLLKGIGFASLGLMLNISITLFFESIQSMQMVVILIMTTIMILKYKTSIFASIVVAPIAYFIMSLF